MTEIQAARPAALAFPDDLQGADPMALSAQEMQAWSAFLHSHALVARRLEAELLSGANLSLAYYDVLVQLATTEGHELRMHQLADRVVLSRSGVTRLVDRLEAEGLVSRRVCSSDARGSFAVLTPAGLERLREATPTHLSGVRRHFLAALSTDDQAELTRLLELVIDRND